MKYGTIFFFFFFCPTLLDFHLRILNIKWIYIYTLKAEFFSPFFFVVFLYFMSTDDL